MKYEIIELGLFSGNRSTIYAIKIEGNDETLFEKFVRKYDFSHPLETENMVT